MDNSISIALLKNELIVEILQLGDESFLQNLKLYITYKKNKNNYLKRVIRIETYGYLSHTHPGYVS